jgi:hypothetical protein
MIILPRQARDKHREKLKKERNVVSAGPIRLASDPSLALFIAPVAPVAPDGVALMIGAGNASFAMPFYAKNDHFSKTGSGQT